MPNRKTQAAIIADVEDLIRDDDETLGVSRLVGLATGDMANRLQGSVQFTTVQTGTFNTDQFVQTYDFSTSKNISVNPIAISFTESGFRTTPEYRPWAEFDHQYLRELKKHGVKGEPRFWTHRTSDGKEGSIDIYTYPAAWKTYTITMLLKFQPHMVTDVDYPVVALSMEHLLTLATGYYSSRMIMLDTTTLWFRELRDAVEAFDRAPVVNAGPVGGYTPGGVRVSRARGVVRDYGSAPAVAWDDNPAIPYDPANPTEGFPT